MKRFKRWFNCKFRGIHRYSLYTGKCTVCGKEMNVDNRTKRAK